MIEVGGTLYFSSLRRRASSPFFPLSLELSLSLSPARRCTPLATLPQFFSVQSNGKHFGDELRSLLPESAYIHGINANSCRAYFALFSLKSERANNVSRYRFISRNARRDAARKFTFVDVALFVLRDAKLDKA